jgi:hypothetical protein
LVPPTAESQIRILAISSSDHIKFHAVQDTAQNLPASQAIWYSHLFVVNISVFSLDISLNALGR